MEKSGALEILTHGLSTARTRVNVLASNIANAETTRTPEGGPYRRRDVVQVGKPVTFSDSLDRITLAQPEVKAVVADQSEPRKVYQPGHPDADAEGFVSFPNINVVTTMTDMISASRLYQANVTAIENLRTMERDAGSIAQIA